MDLKPGDRVLDIGCNDGTLLGCYDPRTFTVGIDPCSDLVAEGIKSKRIDVGITDFFSATNVKKAFAGLGLTTDIKFKIITSVAMFYDVPDPVQFLRDCKSLLMKDGVLVIQMNYLGSMLRDTAFDFICHEHLALYSVASLKHAVELAGLDFQGLETSESNGGSIRAYITHPEFVNFAVGTKDKLWLYTNVMMKLQDEMRMGLTHKITYEVFYNNIRTKMLRLGDHLVRLQGVGAKIYVAGASTRGTVLLQFLYDETGWGKPGIDSPLLGVAERDKTKIGLKMVGSWLDIMSEDLVRSKATHMLVLPWHFKDSIVRRESEWIARGGELIFPLPVPTVVNKSTKMETFTHSQAI